MNDKNLTKIIGGISGTLIILGSIYMAVNNISYWGWITFVGFVIICGALGI